MHRGKCIKHHHGKSRPKSIPEPFFGAPSSFVVHISQLGNESHFRPGWTVPRRCVNIQSRETSGWDITLLITQRNATASQRGRCVISYPTRLQIVCENTRPRHRTIPHRYHGCEIPGPNPQPWYIHLAHSPLLPFLPSNTANESPTSSREKNRAALLTIVL